MRRFIILFAGLGAAAMMLVPFAQANVAGNHNPARCDGKAKPVKGKLVKLVVNVNFTLSNDFDSSVAGNAWANDTINRHLQIWQVGTDSFCAIVQDVGRFVTFAGTSPGGTGLVSGGITGRMAGGYATDSFTGTFVPQQPTRGNLGTFNLACGPSPAPGYTCNGAPDRPSAFNTSYFSTAPSPSYSWGWKYHTSQHGNWVNADSGNAGDITG